VDDAIQWMLRMVDRLRRHTPAAGEVKAG